MKRFIIILLFIPMVLCARQYTLDELIQLGIEKSTSSQKSRLSTASAASNLATSKWNLLPEASVNLSAEQKIYNPLPVGSDISSGVGVTLSKTISMNDPAWFQYKQARIDVQSTQYREEKTRSAYIYQIFNAYIEVLSAEKQQKSLRDNLTIQSRILEQSRALKAQGRITDFDVKQNEIAVLNSEISLLKIQNQIDKSRNNLFSLVLIEDEGYPISELEFTAEYMVPELNYETNLDIRLLNSELRKNDLTLNKERLDLWPKISISYNFNRSVSGFDFDFDNYNSSHGFSLNASYSLWNQFRQSESTKRAKISRQMNQLDLIDKKDEIRLEYENLKLELTYLLQLNELYNEKYNQATEQLRTAEERYRFGMIAQLDLDKTRSELLDADIARNTNRYQIMVSREALNLLLSNKILGKW